MPNHVKTIIKIRGKKTLIQEAFDAVRGEPFEDGSDRVIDFEKIIKMPAHIYKEDLSLEEEEKRGKENCWYDWSIKNWGTKWNAYSMGSNISKGELWFETAWAAPFPIYDKLASIFPGLEFVMRYADEDIGRNLGKMRYLYGQRVHCESPAGESSKQDRDFARRIWAHPIKSEKRARI